MDWDDLKFVQAIARCGSIAAAARALGTTQPTVSRRLDGFERHVGAKLFEREIQGLSPTPLCSALLESLDEMAAAADAVERRIAARDTGLQGRITITTLAWFGDEVLAPLLACFSSQHPAVSIDLINDPRLFNLSRLEADIALRIPGSFVQEDIVERKIADVSYGLYVSPQYLKHHGPPDFAGGAAGHFVASLVESSLKVTHVEWLRKIAPAAHIVLRTNGLQSHVAAAEAGQALAVLPRIMGDRRAALVRPRIAAPRTFGADQTRCPLGHARFAAHPCMINFLVREVRALASQLNPAA